MDEHEENARNVILKKHHETLKLEAEARRRCAVAQEKFAGYMIEYIELERKRQKLESEKQRQRKELGAIFGLTQRISDSRQSVMLAMTQAISNSESVPIDRLVDAYGRLRSKLLGVFGEEDEDVENIPIVNVEGSDSVVKKLNELNVALGEMYGYALGKFWEILP